MKLLRKITHSAVAAAACLVCANAASAGVPQLGCYERVYDTAHLAAHPGQLVTRSTVLIKPAADAATKAALGPSYELDAILRFWVRGQERSFDSHGTCKTANGGLACVGSVSAAEDDGCKTDRDGVRNNCHISAANDGAFGVTAQSDGLMVKITRRLELVTAPYDGGPFLYLSPGNAENHAFLLKPAPDQACK
jgi:hypothetical protein